jgi:hypothetical protein
VKTSAFSAEYGHAAGYVMNATIKSSTNQFHGHLWEFLRNDKLDANNFVANFAGQPRAKFRQDPYFLPGIARRDFSSLDQHRRRSEF